MPSKLAVGISSKYCNNGFDEQKRLNLYFPFMLFLFIYKKTTTKTKQERNNSHFFYSFVVVEVLNCVWLFAIACSAT